MGPDSSRINEFSFRAYTVRRLLTKGAVSRGELPRYASSGYAELPENAFAPWLASLC